MTRPPNAEENPFSPLAIARVNATDEVTVETDAVRAAAAELAAFLTPTAPDGDGLPPGNVVAVVGDYGTGKSHLATWLRNRAAGSPLPIVAVYLESMSANFISVYRRVVAQLGKESVRSRVVETYKDVIAGHLAGSDLFRALASRLRADDLDPFDMIERLRLPESELQRITAERLARVTQNDAFTIALTLLLRGGFDEMVWEWLNGAQPDKVLTEQGIPAAIDTEAAALEALGVLALLYGGRQRRFLLLLDEADKVLVSRDRDSDFVPALKQLLQVFVASGAMLVLVGLPDMQSELTEDVRLRISRTITTRGLTGDDVRALIGDLQHRQFNTRRLAPFTAETVDYLTALADGNPRRIIRMCHHLYRRASGGAVSMAMVREVALELAPTGGATVATRVRQFFDAQGWDYRTRYRYGNQDDAVVDFLVTFDGGGCAVLLCGSVLGDEDVRRLTRRATAVRGGLPGVELLLVVDGVVAEAMAAALADVFPPRPLVFSPENIGEDLLSLFDAKVKRLRAVNEAGDASVLRDRVEQVVRQQAQLFTAIDQLTAGLADNARYLEGLVTAQRVPDDAVPAQRAREMPEAVDRLFRAALGAMDRTEEWHEVLAAAFGPDAARALDQKYLNELRVVRFREELAGSVLVVDVVRRLRKAVAEWFGGLAGDLPSTAERDRLDMLMLNYEELRTSLPSPRGDALPPPDGQVDLRETVGGLAQLLLDAVNRWSEQGGFGPR
ncbi:hypothetical protein V5P93_005359 [Actinokineospora auranticolor]|uniref:AAA+ ATPase domain-containing protein n=1 Tax=Actinokineospora auranticolor TaxID=155976 RepID=A0A2S6GQV7_9PSEU|nr:hypothetical protein [Actinokineospora auranticolor]PPK67614.1 hypothetical protein CLV40_107280 [Actinokineospora auranticolor]